MCLDLVSDCLSWLALVRVGNKGCLNEAQFNLLLHHVLHSTSLHDRECLRNVGSLPCLFPESYPQKPVWMSVKVHDTKMNAAAVNSK